MTDTLWLDIETYSSVDLKKFGVYAYAASPDFEILMCAWSTELDGPTHIAVGWDEINAIPGLWDDDVVKEAQNAQFERVCFSNFLVPGTTEYLDPQYWMCTAAMGAEVGLPQSLEQMAKALGAEEKDSAGTRLINLFCKPQRGKRVMPEDKPEQWEEFKAYCIQDVDTMKDIRRRVKGWPNELERQVYIVDQKINDRGLAVDLDLARVAIETDAKNQIAYREEMCTILEIDNAGSVQQIQKALAREKLVLPDLRQETVEKTLARTNLNHVQRRALELRKETALVASKKFEAVVGAANADSRYRGGLKFFGAHTGRWSSKGVQIQNLPKETIDHPEAAILDLHLGLGADALTLKALVRSLFVGPYTVVDYASIEARILAWIANEQWALDAFADKRDIYVETANRMGGLTRSQGKIAVLALGFAGSVGSLRGMGYGVGMSDEKVLELVYAWRRANPKIVRTWKQFESVFMSGGEIARVNVVKDGKDRAVVLPSGRPIVYRNVGLSQHGGQHGPRIMFDGAKGFRTDTYGGRLTENVVQAISRDILAQALLNLDEEGLDVVAHIHDEAVIEGTHDIEYVSKVMCDVSWAKGLPLDAEGFHCDRYMKG